MTHVALLPSLGVAIGGRERYSSDDLIGRRESRDWQALRGIGGRQVPSRQDVAYCEGNAMRLCVQVLCLVAVQVVRSMRAAEVTCPLAAKIYSADMTAALFEMRSDWVAGTAPRASLTAKQCTYFSSLGSVYGSSTAALELPNDPVRYTEATANVRPLGMRKEYRQLSRAERERFHQALNAMKSAYPDASSRTSEYDIFVRYQQRHEAPGARYGAAFLPWHREFIWR